jgi:formate dehydrogenase major subunit
MNSVEEPVNRLTSSYTDDATHTPAYKEASVRMTVLSPTGRDPLPRSNSRHGVPTPQKGVEVERKWARADYHQPGQHLVQIQSAAPAAAGEER